MAFLDKAGVEHLWTHIISKLSNKVDKIEGKGLSTNDYTTTEKNKLSGIAEGATKVIVDSALSSTSTNPVQNKAVNTAINNLTTLVGDTSVSSQISNAIASKSDTGHTHDDRYYTETEIDNKLSGKSDTSHTHSSYVNQNAFSNVKVGSSTVTADSATDTLTLTAGDNITLTADTTNDGITIAAKDTVYTHPTTSGNKHIPSGGSSGQILRWSADGTAVWGADNNTTYSNATTSAAGLMSASDKTKLDGIATEANKTTVDSALSSTSTNPVQNKVVNTAISNLTSLVGDTSVASQVDTALTTAKSYTDTKVAGIVDSAPETLDTLNELSAALGDDPNFATTVANQIGNKADANHTHKYAGSSSVGGAANSVANSMTVQLNGGTTEGTNKFTFNGSAAKSVNITPSGIGAAASSHTHSYAGSSSAGGSATSAVKLDSSAGDSNTPVYFSGGKPVACTSLDLNTSGNAATATKATQDGSGNNIVNTYATKTELTSVSELVGDTSVSNQISTALTSYEPKSNVTSKGSATQPVYFDSNGVAQPTTYTLGKSVPSNAVFTDTDTKVTQTAVTTSGYTNWRPLVIGSSNSETEGFSPSTVTDTTITANTLSCQPSSGTIKATTFKGNATTATKLATARTIGLGTGATGTATSFDGSGNITIPVTSVKEAYLDWGGRNISGGVTPVGASLSSEHSANRLAYLNPNAITVEYSDNAGSTWTDYGISNANKIGFVTTSASIPIGYASTVTTNHRTRITITAQDGTNGYVYTRPRKMLLNVSTAGHGMSVTIETKTGASNASWATVGTYALSGWSGWNDIPISFSTLGGGKTQTSNIWYMRLTFATTSVLSNYTTRKSTILGMRLFGDTCWTKTSNMGETGHLYSYDTSQNATFPATVTATSFSGNLTGTATKATQDGSGNNIVNTYATKTALNSVSSLVGDTSVASQITSATAKKIDNIGVTTAGTGAAYTATVSSISALTAGVSFIMVPHTVSTSTAPTLNVNGLGAKTLKRRLSNMATAKQAGYNTTWLAANTPFRITYDGTDWIVEGQTKPAAADLYGTLPIDRGGTGATTAEEAKINLGIQTINGTTISENTDYAEVGEWTDGNPNNEGRIGYFVAIDEETEGTTMVIATSTSDVRGVTVAAPAFSGNCEDSKFGEDGSLLQQYDYVAVMGIVPVIDNGTCTINGRCMPADDGTAVPSSNNMGYQVFSRIDNTHVLIAVEPSADMLSRIKTDVSGKANISHNQASNTINAMTGYSKPSSTSAIATSDTLNLAVGKLEKSLDYKLNYTEIAATDTAPINIAQGGTGATSASAARANLGVAGYDIVAGEPSVQPLSIANGGTGATTAEQARINLGVEPTIYDSGWITASLTSDFTAYDATTLPKYRKVGKMVEVVGAVKSTSAIAGSDTKYTIFTLPVGYRPSYTPILVVCQGSGTNIWTLRIDTAGIVSFERYRSGTSYVATSTSSWLPFHAMFFAD